MKRRLSLGALSAAILAGCYIAVGVGYPGYYYDDGYYASYYYGYEGLLVYGWADASATYAVSAGPPGLATQVALSAAATDLAAKAGQSFSPPGCATATASGASVSYAFNNCVGRFGIGSLSGTTNIELSHDAGHLVLTAKSNQLVVDGQPSLLDLTATLVDAGNQRTATIHSRTYRPDHLDARESRGTITWTSGSGCIDVTGQATSARGSLSASSAIDGLKLCDTLCPSQGLITVTGQNVLFNARFDGSSTETVSDPSGQSRTYNLQCR